MGSPAPTKLPKVSTTLPGSPVVIINLVEDTFNEIRKIVVNKSIVGNAAIFSTSLENKALNKTTNAIAIFNANKKSNKIDGIGTIRKMIAASKYKPIAKSAFFISITSLSFLNHTPRKNLIN